jgi:hypothetical protein
MAIKERDYILCAGHTEDGAPCPFFIEVNSAHEDNPDDIAPWVHLTRGNDHDNALEDHEAVPGEAHTLEWWQDNGPFRVRERFTDVALDVWLRFGPNDQTDDAEAEANVYGTEDGTYDVQWYLTAVGLITHVPFATYADATAFLAREGFEDFTS